MVHTSRSQESQCVKDWAVRRQELVRGGRKKPSGQCVESSECHSQKFGLYLSSVRFVFEIISICFYLVKHFSFCASGFLYSEFLNIEQIITQSSLQDGHESQTWPVQAQLLVILRRYITNQVQVILIDYNKLFGTIKWQAFYINHNPKLIEIR